MRDLLCLDKPRALHAERSMYATPALIGAVLYSLLRLAATDDGASTSAAAAVEAAAAAIWDGGAGDHASPDAGSTLGWMAGMVGWGEGSHVSHGGAPSPAAAAASAAAAAAGGGGSPAAAAAASAGHDLSASLPFDATYFIPWAVCLLLRWAAWTWRLALPHWARRRQSIFGDVPRSLRPLMLTPSEPTFTVKRQPPPSGVMLLVLRSGESTGTECALTTDTGPLTQPYPHRIPSLLWVARDTDPLHHFLIRRILSQTSHESRGGEPDPDRLPFFQLTFSPPPSAQCSQVSIKKAQGGEPDSDRSSYFRLRPRFFRRRLVRPVLANFRRPPKLRLPLVSFRLRRSAAEEKKKAEGDGPGAAEASPPAAT
jgi:hypothetical protein